MASNSVGTITEEMTDRAHRVLKDVQGGGGARRLHLTRSIPVRKEEGRGGRWWWW